MHPFCSGARNTYIIPEIARKLTTTKLYLSGETKSSTQAALLVGEIEGRTFHTEAMVIDHIGEDEEGNAIEILFGALAMQQWGIQLVLEQEKLDLTHYPTEFVEYQE